MRGIEPPYSAWEADVLPLNYIRGRLESSGREPAGGAGVLARVPIVILSDRSLREAIGSGRIVIDPFDPSTVQPSSIDVRVDRLFRVFRNHTAGMIDVKLDLSDLTELIDIAPE